LTTLPFCRLRSPTAKRVEYLLPFLRTGPFPCPPCHDLFLAGIYEEIVVFLCIKIRFRFKPFLCVWWAFPPFTFSSSLLIPCQTSTVLAPHPVFLIQDWAGRFPSWLLLGFQLNLRTFEAPDVNSSPLPLSGFPLPPSFFHPGWSGRRFSVFRTSSSERRVTSF